MCSNHEVVCANYFSLTLKLGANTSVMAVSITVKRCNLNLVE